MISLTDNAIKKLKQFVEPWEVVRLAVEGGGCAGFQYRFGLVPIEETFEDDYIVEKLGIKLFVDAISYMYLENVEIDYEDTHFSSAFKINNPDTIRTCGCGSSFS